jgi:hypothetical protein
MAQVLVDDLTDLWDAGAVKLPQVAAQYAAVAQALHQSALSEDQAFQPRSSIPYVTSQNVCLGPGPLHAVWVSLRSLMQDEVAVRTYNNLLAAGRALTQIADGYATTEYLNADQVGQYHDAIEDIQQSPNPNGRPPDQVPDAPASSDPHPEEQPLPVGGPY